MPEKKVQFIINLRFQSDKLFENMLDVSFEEKTSIEDDDIIYLSDIFKEYIQPTLNLSSEPTSTIEVVQQNQIEEVELI